MAIKKQGVVKAPKTSPEKPESRSLELAERGITNLMEMAQFTLATATDVIRGAVTASNANASATNIGKTLKAIEMQLKYGPQSDATIKLLGSK